MTNQEAFNRVWDHFVVKKGKPSMSKDGNCKYRGPNGAKCAVGVLIPDEAYRESYDSDGGYSLYTLISDPPVSSVLCGVTPGLLFAMQHVHDASAKALRRDFHSMVEQGLRELAVVYDLIIPS